jgi:hypothetical protein
MTSLHRWPSTRPRSSLYTRTNCRVADPAAPVNTFGERLTRFLEPPKRGSFIITLPSTFNKSDRTISTIRRLA